MNRSTASVLAALAFAAVAGCASSSPAGQAPSTSLQSAASIPGATPADPVAIVRQAGAAPDPGEVYGGHDIQGDRTATGSWPGGETIDVTTSATQEAYQAAVSRNGTGDDQHRIIIIPGKLAMIVLTAGVDETTNAPVWKPAAAVTAQRTGGQLLTPA